jgi:hypothetical protein
VTAVDRTMQFAVVCLMECICGHEIVVSWACALKLLLVVTAIAGGLH